MPPIGIALDPEWVKRELLYRGKNGRWLVEQGLTKDSRTRLLNGQPVTRLTLVKLNALFATTPYAPEYNYLATHEPTRRKPDA